MRRHGGWTIELALPLDGVKEISIEPCTLDHTIRWSRGEIPSVLALIAELSGLKEKQLKKLSGNDTDRLFIAFSFVATGQIKKDFEGGTRPLATPPDLMSPEDQYEEAAGENDEQDPRFPKVDGPVTRFREPPVESDPTADNGHGGMSIGGTEVLKKVS